MTLLELSCVVVVSGVPVLCALPVAGAYACALACRRGARGQLRPDRADERPTGRVHGVCTWTRARSLADAGTISVLHLPLFVFGMALARLYLFGQARSSRLHAAMLGSGVILLVLIFGAGASMLPHGCSAMRRSCSSSRWSYSVAPARPAPSRCSPAGLHPARRGKLLDLHPPHSTALLVGRFLSNAMPGLSLTPWLDFLLYFGFVVLVSVVVFRRVETPMRQWIAGRESREPACQCRADPANERRILAAGLIPARSRVSVLLTGSSPGNGHSAHHQVCIRSDCHWRGEARSIMLLSSDSRSVYA